MGGSLKGESPDWELAVFILLFSVVQDQIVAQGRGRGRTVCLHTRGFGNHKLKPQPQIRVERAGEAYKK